MKIFRHVQNFISVVTDLFLIQSVDVAEQSESTMEQGNDSCLDRASQIPGEGLTSKDTEEQVNLSQQSTESTANTNEPQSQPDSIGLASHEESSTRSSAFQETDDSDDDPVLIPGARYRGGAGHRFV